MLVVAWKTRKTWLQHLRHDAGQTVDFYLDNAGREDVASYVIRLKFRIRTGWLLSLFAGFTLLFFSLSTNQEYYTFPAWPPLLILIASIIAGIEENRGPAGGKAPLSTAWLTWAQGIFAAVGMVAAAALGWGLWTSRNLPNVDDIGTLLAHRGVGDYTLSMSHLFDLTGPSFAALRLPAGSCGRPDVAPQGKASRFDGQRSHHRSCLPDRRTHCFCALRSHAEQQATGGHHRGQRFACRHVHHLRGPVGRFFSGLLCQWLPAQAGPAGA